MTREEIVRAAARRLADAAPEPSDEVVDRVASTLARARRAADEPAQDSPAA